MASSDRPLNVGIIGYGMSAKIFHIPFIHANKPSLTLHSIVQRHPQAGNSAPEDHKAIRHHKDVSSMLDDPDVDIVIVTTPPDTHFSLTEASLKKGKHVLVEKPFVPTVAEAKKLTALGEQVGKFICVFQNRRWDADFLTVRQLISSKKLGRIVEFETHFDRYRPEKPTNWKASLSTKSGGGPLFDLGTHLIDQVYALFGMPKAVFGKFLDQRDGKLDVEEPDGVTALLSYEDGMVAYVRIGVMSVEKKQPRFWIRGTKGSFKKTGLDMQEPQLKEGMSTDDAEFGKEGQEWAGTLSTIGEGGDVKEESWPNVEPETYKKVLEGFAAAIKGQKKEGVPVKAEEATDVLRIVEGIIESAKTRTEVRL